MEARRLTVLLTLLLLASTVTAIAPVEGQASYELKYVEFTLAPIVEGILQDAVLRVMIPLPKDLFSGCNFEARDPVTLNKVPVFLLRCLDGDTTITLYPSQVWWTTTAPTSDWYTKIDYVGGSISPATIKYPTYPSPIFHYAPENTNYDVIGYPNDFANSQTTVYFRMLLNLPLPVQSAIVTQTWLGTSSAVYVNGVAYGSSSTATAISPRSFTVNLNAGLNLIAFSVTSYDVNADGYQDVRAEIQVKVNFPGYWIADAFIRAPRAVTAGSVLNIMVLPSPSSPRDGGVFKYWFDDFNVWDSSKYTVTVSSGTPAITVTSDGWLELGVSSFGGYFYIAANIASWPPDAVQVMVFKVWSSSSSYICMVGYENFYMMGNPAPTSLFYDGPPLGGALTDTGNPALLVLTTDSVRRHYYVEIYFSRFAKTKVAFLQGYTGSGTTQSRVYYYTSYSNAYVKAYVDFYGIGVKPPKDYRGWQHYYGGVKTITFASTAIQTAEGVKSALKISFNTTIYGGDVYQGAAKFENGLLASGSSTVFTSRSSFLAQIKHNASFTLLAGTLANGVLNVLEKLELQESTLKLLVNETSAVLTLNGVSVQGYSQLVVAGSARRLVHVGDTVKYAETSLEAKLFNATLASEQGALEVLVMAGPYPTFRGQGLLALEIEGVDGAGRSLKLFTYDGKYMTSGYDIEPQPEVVVFAYPFVYPVNAKVTYYLDMTTGLGFALTVPSIKYAPVTWTYNVSAPAGANWLVEGLAGFLNNLPLPGDYKPYIAYAVVLATLLTVPVLPPAVALVLAVFLVIVFMAAGWISLSGGWLALLALIVVVAFLMYRQKVYPY